MYMCDTICILLYQYSVLYAATTNPSLLLDGKCREIRTQNRVCRTETVSIYLIEVTDVRANSRLWRLSITYTQITNNHNEWFASHSTQTGHFGEKSFQHTRTRTHQSMATCVRILVKRPAPSGWILCRHAVKGKWRGRLELPKTMTVITRYTELHSPRKGSRYNYRPIEENRKRN